MKELTKSLKEQKGPSKKEISKEKDGIKQFINQLGELTGLDKPRKRNTICFQASNKELNTKFNNILASSSQLTYIPAEQGPRLKYKSTHCIKYGNTFSRFNDSTEDLEKCILIKTRIYFYFRNFHRVPIEGEKIPRELVRDFAAEEEVLKITFLEEKDETAPKAEEKKKEER
ncbi:hypothetical protein O181_113510 [Austropuccinia psidii MF-1]|uniref:Uncharacterized protein n=1 Tax=Austropuccinia psidii MF-1 TaxID=1389203 RepID=A0A9Q3K2M5_9BASI|nr:hypothetical protein [Austropuccinia psidii MF-1]